MKHTLHFSFSLSLVMSVMLLWMNFSPVSAERAVWGYCGGQIADGKQGAAVARSGNNAWIDCCIRIPVEFISFFSGNRVTAVRVGLMDTAPQVDSIVVWVRSAKEEANLVEARMYGVQEGWNEVALPTGYDIDGTTDLYVGFSYYQKKKITAISLAGTPTADGVWTAVNHDKWDNGYATRGALSVEAVIEGEQLPHRSVVLTSATMGMSRYRIGDVMSVSGTLQNPAVDTLRQVALAYTFDDQTQPAGYDTVQVSIPYLGSTTVRASIATEGLAAGVHTVHIAPQLPAEASADRPAKGSADFTFTLVDNAYTRYAVIEEFTSEYCSNCPDGAARIHAALEASDLADQVILLCPHAGYGWDWLSNEVAQAYEWFYIPPYSYAPAMMLDRTYIEGICDYDEDSAYYSAMSSVESAAIIRQNFEAHIQEMATVGVGVTATLTDGTIHISVTGERNSIFVEECAAPRLTVLIKESGIAAISQSGASGGYIHNNVVRAAASDTWGDPIVWNGDSFAADYTLTPDADWDLSQVEVVAFVSDYSATDRSGCRIFNAAQTALNLQGTSALETVGGSGCVVVAQYYTSLSGARQTEGRGLCLRHTRYADGTTRVEKVVVK
jgi:hypothetical protein